MTKAQRKQYPYAFKTGFELNFRGGKSSFHSPVCEVIMQPSKLGLNFPLISVPSMPFVVIMVLKIVSSGGFNPKDTDVSYRSKCGNHE